MDFIYRCLIYGQIDCWSRLIDWLTWLYGKLLSLSLLLLRLMRVYACVRVTFSFCSICTSSRPKLSDGGRVSEITSLRIKIQLQNFANGHTDIFNVGFGERSFRLSHGQIPTWRSNLLGCSCTNISSSSTRCEPRFGAARGEDSWIRKVYGQT